MTRDLDDTDDDPPRARTGPVERVLEPFYDCGPDDPRAPANVDFHDRIAALEAAMPSTVTNARWIRRGVWALGSIAGLGSAVFLWALATAQARGDRLATERDLQIRRLELRATVKAIVEQAIPELRAAIADLHGELRRINPIGSIPLIGPPNKEPSP